MSPVRFDETKATQAACRFIELAGGRLNYMVLIKYLYLLDRHMLIHHGQTVTGDEFFTMRMGPVLSRVYDLITEESKEPSFWNEHIAPPSAYRVSLLKPAGNDRLSDREEKLIQSIWNDFKDYSPFDLVDLLHSILPEIKTIDEGRIPLTFTEILTLGGNKSDRETQEILEDLASVNAVHSLLAARRNA